MSDISDYDQDRVDRLCRAIAWAAGNERTASRLAQMSVEESGMGEPTPDRRWKILGILRDALRQKSVGLIEEVPEQGIAKYAKPAGVVAALIPVTNSYVTPVGIAIYAVKCKDAVIFCPHPASRKTTNEAVRVMRAALTRLDTPENILQCVEKPNDPLVKELLSSSDLIIASGAPRLVKLAQASGTPTYGVGTGNPAIVIDETANLQDAARNCQISKSNDNGSGCSAESNLLVEASVYEQFLKELQLHAGYLLDEDEKRLLQAVYWDEDRYRTLETIARPASHVAELAGFRIPSDKKFLIAQEESISKENLFCTEKLGCLLSLFKYSGFDMALEMVQKLLCIGGRGHSLGIYSFTDEHIHRLALASPVSRVMVRQPHSTSNAGSFTNGMPMTSSLGCGVWGGNVSNENISLKHYMNVTWVSRPIPEDRVSDEELFGEFYNSEIF